MTEITTKWGSYIALEPVLVQRYQVGDEIFEDQKKAERAVRKQVMQKVRDFARFVVAVGDDIPQALEPEIKPIVVAIATSGVDWAQRAADAAGGAE